jgi:hypothetical protein
MKSKIDLKNPVVKQAIQSLHEKTVAALNVTQKVERAVIPIYALLKTKPHQKPKRKPEQIASGVIVNIKDHYFIFSATHVFLEIGSYGLLTGVGDGSALETLFGERLSTGKASLPKEDIYDATVFHIKSELSASLKEIALTLDDFDLSNEQDDKPIYMACGFRIKKSNTQGSQAKCKRDCFPSIEYNNEHYAGLGFNSNSHIALAYEKKTLINNQWFSSPIPRGISGGAIIKFAGTNAFSSENKDIRQLLTAITIEYHEEKGVKKGALIGTRVRVHLGLLYQDMPDLFTEYIESVNNKNDL